MAMAAAAGSGPIVTREEERRVIFASSLGTVFEWYDFYLYATLAPFFAALFFPPGNETAALLSAFAAYAAGFLVRPFGALVFGRIGDQSGRKGAFLVTVTLMGLATVAIGLLPTYASAGIIAPILLILMRILQGFALGGEYGGAATYVAEHAPPNARGRSTSWVQTSAAFGLFAALLVILATRVVVGHAFGPDAFDAWGWRIPFLFSAGLLAVSIFMRLKLAESPAFAAMKAEGETCKAPLAEAFGRWPNMKLVLIAFFGVMCSQGAVWYTAFFYAQTFMEKFLKVPPETINLLMIAATATSAVTYVIFGTLSDRIGRKPVMLAGMILMLVAYFPGFHLLSSTLNPALAEAVERTPVVVVAPKSDCSNQFDPVGKASFLSACDIAKSSLANAGVSYSNKAAPGGSLAEVHIGDAVIQSVDARSLAPAEAKAAKAAIEGRVRAALTAAGYPAKADPERMNVLGAYGVLFVFVIAATALYGPMAAALVELFPTRIRYTAMSLPYHVGTGWIGGFVPFSAFAIVIAVGDIYAGLWFPFVFTAISVVACILVLPETKGRDLHF